STGTVIPVAEGSASEQSHTTVPTRSGSGLDRRARPGSRGTRSPSSVDDTDVTARRQCRIEPTADHGREPPRVTVSCRDIDPGARRRLGAIRADVGSPPVGLRPDCIGVAGIAHRSGVMAQVLLEAVLDRPDTTDVAAA